MMKAIPRFPILCSISFVLFCTLNADAPQRLPAQTAACEQAYLLLDRLRSETKTPGISGAVAKGGKLVYSGGVGLIDVENSVPAGGESVYNIGSLSKAVTAIAVMQLVEEKRVALEGDIRKYIPDFPDKGAKITIRHLLADGCPHQKEENISLCQGRSMVHLPCSSSRFGMMMLTSIFAISLVVGRQKSSANL